MKTILIGILLLLFGAIAVPVVAQNPLIVEDETGRLDPPFIEEAAQPLIEKGAIVAVYFVGNGGNSSDVLDKMAGDGLSRGSLTQDEAIVIYVSLEPRWAEIRFGDNWVADLDDEADTVRTQVLVPELQAGNFNTAFADTLEEIDTIIEGRPIWERMLRAVPTSWEIYLIIGIVLWFIYAAWKGNINWSSAGGGGWSGGTSGGSSGGSSGGYGSGGSSGGGW